MEEASIEWMATGQDARPVRNTVVPLPGFLQQSADADCEAPAACGMQKVFPLSFPAPSVCLCVCVSVCLSLYALPASRCRHVVARVKVFFSVFFFFLASFVVFYRGEFQIGGALLSLSLGPKLSPSLRELGTFSG